MNDASIDLWWPTPIYETHLTGDTLETVQSGFHAAVKDLKNRKAFTRVKAWNRQSIQLNDGSFQKDVIEQYELTTFKQELIKHCAKFASYYNKNKLDFQIDSSWITISGPGESAHVHDHNHADLSGVYYIQASGDEGDIYFLTTNKVLKSSLVFREGGAAIHHRPETGKLLLFPGFLEHGIRENETNKERISFAFNIFVYDERRKGI